MIKIIDCGSQLTQNIARRIREQGVYSTIVTYKTPLKKILTDNPDGLIISGGQFSVYDKRSPLYDKKILDLKISILGICYGQQSIAYLLKGKVKPTKKREYGKTKISVKTNSPLFKGIKKKNFVVWMSHGDIVKKLPRGFKIIAESENKHIASIQKDNIYAVQFHPEVDHTQYGRMILKNFLDICQAKKDWNPKDFIKSTIKQIRGKVGDKTVIGGLSGGVDSSTASVLLAKALGKKFIPIFVNNGLLRQNEAEQVLKSLKPYVKNIHYVDASKRFLKKLKNVTDPDKKRKIIGHEFIYVFQETAKKIKNVKFLLQGTLYPDIIESVPIYGVSSKIKRHHNVGGLPKKMHLKLIEPFKELFKDEVRVISQKLGLPKEIVWRHPFPGPGLAIRIIGDVTEKKLKLLRAADQIYIEELKKRGLYYKIGQAFTVLTASKSVGVMGDEGSYQAIIGLRAATTSDFMTADWYDFKKDDLTEISNRIINEVKGVNRVVYDVTQKPPGTIEWE